MKGMHAYSGTLSEPPTGAGLSYPLLLYACGEKYDRASCPHILCSASSPSPSVSFLLLWIYDPLDFVYDPIASVSRMLREFSQS